jgi:hypothetical protein
MARPAVRIDSTGFGEISINGKTYYSDMTVFWNGQVSYRSKEHVIELGELLGVLKKGAKVVVIGLGQNGACRIAPEVEQWAGDKGIGLYKESTPKAIEIFNGFVARGKKVAGIFHVTC